MRWLALVSVAMLFAGCSKPAGQNTGAASSDTATSSRAISDYRGQTGKPSDGAKPGAAAETLTAPGVAMLAYSYAYSLEAPAANVRRLQARHEDMCRGAGPAACQVTGSNIQTSGANSIQATLSLRATPVWINQFRASLAADTKAEGGRVVNATVQSEDLSHDIVDEQAAVKARTALRDRLQGLLETRQGKLSDLLDVETALAKVQGELDASSSELALSRERVATSALTINYESSGVLASDNIWAPLTSAFNDFAGTTVGAFALIIRLISVLLPWGVLAGGGAWIFMRRRAKSGRLPRNNRRDVAPHNQ